MKAIMVEQLEQANLLEPTVSIEEVNRVLEVGRILLSVLTPEELNELRVLYFVDLNQSIPSNHQTKSRIGNTGVT
jgi:hypothetical protein